MSSSDSSSYSSEEYVTKKGKQPKQVINTNVVNELGNVFPNVTPDNFKYVKFSDDNQTEYFLVCDLLVYKWLDTFEDAKEIKNNMDSKLETYNGIEIINYLELDCFDTFKMLYDYLCSGKNINIESENITTKYLITMCKLTSPEKIFNLIKFPDYPINILLSLIDSGFNIFIHLELKQRYEIVRNFIRSGAEENSIKKLLNNGNILWFEFDDTKNLLKNNYYWQNYSYAYYDKYYRLLDEASNMIYNIVVTENRKGKKNNSSSEDSYESDSYYGILYKGTDFVFKDEEIITRKSSKKNITRKSSKKNTKGKQYIIYYQKKDTVDTYLNGNLVKMTLVYTSDVKPKVVKPKAVKPKVDDKKEKTKREPSLYNIFMKEELTRLTNNNPEMTTKEKFHTAVAAWNEFKKNNP